MRVRNFRCCDVMAQSAQQPQPHSESAYSSIIEDRLATEEAPKCSTYDTTDPHTKPTIALPPVSSEGCSRLRLDEEHYWTVHGLDSQAVKLHHASVRCGAHLRENSRSPPGAIVHLERVGVFPLLPITHNTQAHTQRTHVATTRARMDYTGTVVLSCFRKRKRKLGTWLHPRS